VISPQLPCRSSPLLLFKPRFASGQPVRFRGLGVGDGLEIAFEVFAAAGRGFAAERVHGAENGELLPGGGGEELAEGVAFARGQDFDLFFKGVGKFDGDE